MDKGFFLTGKSRLEQTNDDGIWMLLDNELYMDKNGIISLVPRYFLTDNYTIPNWIAWLGGGKSQWDVRPAHQHDLICRFKQKIKVNLSLCQLRSKKLLKEKNKLLVCDDIPVKYLELVTMSKTEADKMFKQMLLDTNCISKTRANILSIGVFFNIGWYLSKDEKFDMNKIYINPI